MRRAVGSTKASDRFRVFTQEPDRLRMLGDRPVELSGLLVGSPQLPVGNREVGSEIDHASEVADRVVEPAGEVVDAAHIGAQDQGEGVELVSPVPMSTKSGSKNRLACRRPISNEIGPSPS